MIAKLPRKLLIGILSAVILTVLAISAVPVMAADSSTTTTTPTTTNHYYYHDNANHHGTTTTSTIEQRPRSSTAGKNQAYCN